jgi:peroxiredoxin
MFLKRKPLNFILISILLIAVGFIAGYYSHIPIRKQILQFKRYREYKIEQQNLIDNFLNKEAPDIATTTINGEKWALQSQKDKIVLLFFWSSTCRFSQSAIPILKDIYKKYHDRDDFAMIGVSLDKDKDMLSCFLSTKEIPWTTLFEEGKGWDNSFSRKFEVHSIPSIWIIDKKGIIRGFQMRVDDIDMTLTSLFKGEEIVTPRPVAQVAGCAD